MQFKHLLDKPHNPLLNSGAIMSSAMLLNLIYPEMKMSEKFDFVTDYLRKMAGGEHVRYAHYYITLKIYIKSS